MEQKNVHIGLFDGLCWKIGLFVRFMGKTRHRRKKGFGKIEGIKIRYSLHLNWARMFIAIFQLSKTSYFCFVNLEVDFLIRIHRILNLLKLYTEIVFNATIYCFVRHSPPTSRIQLYNSESFHCFKTKVIFFSNWFPMLNGGFSVVMHKWIEKKKKNSSDRVRTFAIAFVKWY
jgi:hypothetical protein